MKVVLDTNIIISALISRQGTPARLIRSWLNGRFVLVSHPLQIDELRNVTRREKIRPLFRPSAAGWMVNRIAARAEFPSELAEVERSRDADDDFLLALCEAGGADWLVTGDKDDLPALGRHGATRIATAADLAAALGLKP